MTIIRNEVTRDCTVLSNKILRSKELRWETKGLWAFLMSLPENWEVSVDHLTNMYAKKDKIEGMLKELMQFGLCERIEKRLNGKSKNSHYLVSSNFKSQSIEGIS